MAKIQLFLNPQKFSSFFYPSPLKKIAPPWTDWTNWTGWTGWTDWTRLDGLDGLDGAATESRHRRPGMTKPGGRGCQGRPTWDDETWRTGGCSL